jgi:hypothetical protein
VIFSAPSRRTRPVLRIASIVVIVWDSPRSSFAAPKIETPGNSGLLIVECESSFYGLIPIRSSENVVGGILAGRGGTRRAKATSGLIVFSNLQPGPYRLVAVEMEGVAGKIKTHQTHTIPDQCIPFVTVDIAAGATSFLGKLSIETRSGGVQYKGARFDLVYDEAREREAWKQMLGLYPGSPWTEAIQVAARRTEPAPREVRRDTVRRDALWLPPELFELEFDRVQWVIGSMKFVGDPPRAEVQFVPREQEADQVTERITWDYYGDRSVPLPLKEMVSSHAPPNPCA